MNYHRHYEWLIERARGRLIDGYSERHHVTPRCLGGGNDQANIVRLTPEEHYVAHQLLVKMYPNISALTAAALMMTSRSRYLSRRNKVYGWLRRKYAMQKKGWKHTLEIRALIDEKNRGKKRTESFKAAVGQFHQGRKRPPETGMKISAAAKRRFQEKPELATQISLRMKTRVVSVETRQKQSARRKGRKLSVAHRLKIADALRKPKSPEARENMRRAAKLRAFAKVSAAVEHPAT